MTLNRDQLRELGNNGDRKAARLLTELELLEKLFHQKYAEVKAYARGKADASARTIPNPQPIPGLDD